jgi:hypothetical protein
MSDARLTKKLLMRLRCHLLGCAVDDYACCGYCFAGLYDIDFIQTGKLEPLFRLYWRIRNVLRKLGPKRCDQCGKKYVRGYDEYLCSEECHDNWLPF